MLYFVSKLSLFFAFQHIESQTIGESICEKLERLWI